MRAVRLSRLTYCRATAATWAASRHSWSSRAAGTSGVSMASVITQTTRQAGARLAYARDSCTGGGGGRAITAAISPTRAVARDLITEARPRAQAPTCDS